MLTFIITNIFFSIFSAYETPNPSEWIRKSLVGFNEDQYVYLELKRNNRGSYFSYVDSAFLVTRWTASPDSIHKTLLRATLHEDSTSMGDWHQQDSYNEMVDINQFLVNKKLHYAFSTMRPSHGTLKLQKEGLVLKYKDIGYLLMPMDAVDAYSEELRTFIDYGEVRITDKFDSKEYLYVSVRAGIDASDSEWKEFILPVPMQKVSEGEKSFREMKRN